MCYDAFCPSPQHAGHLLLAAGCQLQIPCAASSDHKGCRRKRLGRADGSHPLGEGVHEDVKLVQAVELGQQLLAQRQQEADGDEGALPARQRLQVLVRRLGPLHPHPDAQLARLMVHLDVPHPAAHPQVPAQQARAQHRLAELQRRPPVSRHRHMNMLRHAGQDLDDELQGHAGASQIGQGLTPNLT